jgi:hypothetical protein
MFKLKQGGMIVGFVQNICLFPFLVTYKQQTLLYILTFVHKFPRPNLQKIKNIKHVCNKYYIYLSRDIKLVSEMYGQS